MPTFKEFMHVAEVAFNDKTSAKRMEQIISIMRKYHVTQGLDPQKAIEVLEALGPTYVKIGQMASTRSDILPQEYCEAFSKLHADVSPLPFETVQQCLSEAYGQPWQNVFSSLSQNPLGSASIAQVHKATLLDGSVVAVKVRRPGIVQEMAEDLTLIKHVLALAEFAVTAHNSMLLSIQNLVDELERTTAEELDFTVELDNLVRFSELNKDQLGVTSPEAYPRYSNESVLVMEYMQGTFINETAALSAQGVNLDELAGRLVQNFVYQALDCGFFHADPHPGNLLVRRASAAFKGNGEKPGGGETGGETGDETEPRAGANASEGDCARAGAGAAAPDDWELVWIDLGMTGSLSVNERALVSKLFHAVATNNAYELKEGVLALSRANGEVDHGKLLAAMDRLLNQYAHADLGEINMGEVFGQISDVLRTQNLVMKPTVTMLMRGVMTLEGVLSDIAPSINVLRIVSVHVLKEELSAQGIKNHLLEAMTSSAESAGAMTKLPLKVSSVLDMLACGELKTNANLAVSDNALSMVYTVCGWIALALISVGLFLGSSILCSTNMEPRFLEVPILGVLGYLGAFVLSVYVIWCVFSSRHRLRNKLGIDQ